MTPLHLFRLQKVLVEEAPDKSALMDRKGGVEDQDIFPTLLRVGEVTHTKAKTLRLGG